VLDENLVCYGSFIDTVDICTFVMQAIDGEAGDLTKAQKVFLNTPSSDVANKSRKNPFHQILHTDTLKTCIGKMVALSNVHRLPVFDLQGSFVGVLSQSQVVNTITDNLPMFTMIANKAVADLRLGLKKVIAVKVSSPIREAFKVIADHRISGVAVVEDNSQSLVGNVSASDIKIVDTHNGGSFDKLNKPIKEVLGETMAKKKPVSVTPSTSIGDVFKTMSKEKIHRLFVVKDHRSNELIGVISLVDLLDLIVNYV